MGTEASRFRGHDAETRKRATALGEAAGRRDGRGTIAAFAELQNSCLACHQAYRGRFVEHFYGRR